jgi:hypothetical protein
MQNNSARVGESAQLQDQDIIILGDYSIAIDLFFLKTGCPVLLLKPILTIENRKKEARLKTQWIDLK